MNGFVATKMRIFEMGLVYYWGTPRKKLDLGAHRHRTESSINGHFIKCIDAVKDYLDRFLDTNATDHQTSNLSRLLFEDWYRLIFAFFVAYKLSIKVVELPSWDTQYARSTFNLEAYLTTFSDKLRRMQSQSELVGDWSQGIDLFSVFPDILESAKVSFVMARDWPQSIPEELHVHIDVHRKRPSYVQDGHLGGSTNETGLGKCPATSFWRREALRVDAAADWTWFDRPEVAVVGGC